MTTNAREAAVHTAMRSIPAVATSSLVLATFAGVAWIPGVAEAFGNASAHLSAAALVHVVTMTAATLAFRRGGLTTRYRVLDAIENGAVAAMFASLAFASPTPVSPVWFFYLFLLLRTAGTTPPQPWSAIGLAVFLAPPAALAGLELIAHGSLARAGVAILALAVAATWLLNARSRGRALAQLAREREQLLAENARLRVQETLAHLGRDLQEGLGTTLAAIGWRSAALTGRARDEALKRELAALGDLASSGIDEIRSVVWACETGERRWSEIAAYLRTRCHELAAADATGARHIAVHESDQAGASGASGGAADGANDPALSGPVAAGFVRVVLESVRAALRRAPQGDVTVRLERARDFTATVEVAMGRDASPSPGMGGSGDTVMNLDTLAARARASGADLTLQRDAAAARIVLRGPGSAPL